MAPHQKIMADEKQQQQVQGGGGLRQRATNGSSSDDTGDASGGAGAGTGAGDGAGGGAGAGAGAGASAHRMATGPLGTTNELCGRVAIVTGANTGVGFGTASALYAKGAYVILACRSAARGQAAVTRIQQSYPGAR